MEATVTLTEHVTACMKCRQPVEWLRLNGRGEATIRPCGHPAAIVLIPNPALAAEQED